MDRSVRITAREYGEWWAGYDEAGLAPDQEPPEALIEVAAGCEVILCSTLPRAIETAAKLVDGARIVPRDAIYVEAPLPPPPIPFLRFNPTTWGRISRVFWFLGFAPGGAENHLRARRRVKAVAAKLAEFAANDGNVLLAAHGYLNWMLDGELKRRGWRKVDHVGGNDFWSWRTYQQKAQKTEQTKEALAAE